MAKVSVGEGLMVESSSTHVGSALEVRAGTIAVVVQMWSYGKKWTKHMNQAFKHHPQVRWELCARAAIKNRAHNGVTERSIACIRHVSSPEETPPYPAVLVYSTSPESNGSKCVDLASTNVSDTLSHTNALSRVIDHPLFVSDERRGRKNDP